MIKTIRALAYIDALRLPPNDNAALISISTPNRDEIVIRGWKHVCVVHFYDSDSITEGCFNYFHAKQIVDFLSGLPEDVETLNIHCYAGISRSPAVAKFAAQFFKIPDPYEKYMVYNRRVLSVLTQYLEEKENG